jgi:hypothetical protein
MPKITRHGGPTNAAEVPAPVEVPTAPQAAETATETATAAPADYSALTVAQLREECKARDLSAGGSKDTLVARLVEAGLT